MIFFTTPDDRTTVHGVDTVDEGFKFLSWLHSVHLAKPKLGSRFLHWAIPDTPTLVGGMPGLDCHWKSVTNDILTSSMSDGQEYTPVPVGGQWRFKITYRTASGGVRDYEVEAHTMIGALTQSRPADAELLLSIELKGEV